jgi:effector-binding domain-containing protein
MPVEEIRNVLAAPDVRSRNELIADHLARLEESLGRTQSAVTALKDLLDHPVDPELAAISHRSIPATPAAAVTDVIDIEDSAAWYEGALGELRGTLSAQGAVPCGPAGGIYASDLFANERGQATLFIPCAGQIRSVGRVEPLDVPPAELAMIVHRGPHATADRSYGALATHVAQHALGVDGPVREYYLTGRADTPDESAWRTEIGWPIFRTGGA